MPPTAPSPAAVRATRATWSRLLAIGATALLCAAAQLGWTAAAGAAPPIWPAGGLVLAAGLLWGPATAAACALAAGAAVLLTAHDVSGAVVTALAALPGPLAATALLRRGRTDPGSRRPVAATAHLLAALVLVAAPIDAVIAVLGRLPEPTSLLAALTAWWHWWLADSLGLVVCTPALLAVAGRAPFDVDPASRPERLRPDAAACGACGALAVLAWAAGRHGVDVAQAAAAGFLVVVLATGLRRGAAATACTLAVGVALLAGPLSGAGVALLAAALAAQLVGALADSAQAGQRACEQTRDQAGGLQDEAALHAALGGCLAASQRSGCALVAVQIANLAAIEQQCGPRATRQLERWMAARLAEQPGLTVAARCSANRFVAVVAADSVAQLRAVARSLYSQLNGRAIETTEGSSALQACIGGLLVEPHAPVDVDDCLGALDDAVAIAASVRDPQLFVEPLSQTVIDARRAHRARLEAVADAIRHARLELYAQPLDDADQASGALQYEVLTRLRDRDGTLISPLEFMPLAEQARLMGALDRAVIERVFAWLSTHSDALARTGRCAINLSGASLADAQLAGFVRQQRAAHGIAAAKIVFEFTERDAIGDPAAASRLFEELKADGHGIALDHFGAGLAAFEYLRRFPLDYLKIDGSFIRNLDTSPIDEELVGSTVRVAHRLEIRTIAEHVHSQRVMDRLQRLGVDHVQGDLIGAPRPLAELFGQVAAVQ